MFITLLLVAIILAVASYFIPQVEKAVRVFAYALIVVYLIQVFGPRV
jgi:hypothetical protein